MLDEASNAISKGLLENMILNSGLQTSLFQDTEPRTRNDAASSTFIDNMRLPVHRWFRFSAGFSAQWVESVIEGASIPSSSITVLDPFAGSGTTLIAAECVGAKASGIEAHVFVSRIAKAKLKYRTNPQSFLAHAKKVIETSNKVKGKIDGYPQLIRKCYEDWALQGLDRLRVAWERHDDRTPQSELVWLALASILRQVSHVGTAPWQYILPNKTKKQRVDPEQAFHSMTVLMASDMNLAQTVKGPNAILLETDARTCGGVPSESVDLVVTSPPYANNYDYADATRLEMCFFGEIGSWGDLQSVVRTRLVRSCAQHVPDGSVNLKEVLAAPELHAVRSELVRVCGELGQIRLQRGGRKTYHNMIATYFLDMAQVWKSLRRVCKSPSEVCFVIGDSAPYGVYVPVVNWMGALAKSAGFEGFRFEKTRDRNLKWRNRKHRVPLCEGRLWVQG